MTQHGKRAAQGYCASSATVQAQMVQMETFSNNAKSTQETNLKMIEFMAMMTQKMGSKEEEEKKPK